MEIIAFTDTALGAISKYREELHIPADYCLRVGIRQKNESNKRLIIGFDAITEKDQAVEIAGMKVIYAKGEIFFFAGMKIDYVEGDGRKGFTFVENKASSV